MRLHSLSNNRTSNNMYDIFLIYILKTIFTKKKKRITKSFQKYMSVSNQRCKMSKRKIVNKNSMGKGLKNKLSAIITLIKRNLTIKAIINTVLH